MVAYGSQLHNSYGASSYGANEESNSLTAASSIGGGLSIPKDGGVRVYNNKVTESHS